MLSTKLLEEAIDNLDYNSGCLILNEQMICPFCGKNLSPKKNGDKWIQTCQCKEHEDYLKRIEELNGLLLKYKTKRMQMEHLLEENAKNVFKKWWIENVYPSAKNDLECVKNDFMGIC